MAAAPSVTSAVTAGLPSRSPPTHVPQRIVVCDPVARTSFGSVVKIVRSNSAIDARTSSRGSGGRGRIGVGEPEARDLLPNPAWGLAVDAAAGPRVVEGVEQVAD